MFRRILSWPKLRSNRWFRPRTESLELRVTPALFFVSNLSDSGPGSLRDVISQTNAMPDVDEIYFDTGLAGTLALTSGQISVTNPVAISGGGQITLSGNNSSRIFSVSGSGSLLVYWMTLTGGKATSGSGGAIEVTGTGTIRAIDCTFVKNTTSFVGGAIAHLNTTAGLIDIDNCSFADNTASNAGGAVYGRTDLDVTNSSFTNNSSANVAFGGGAIHLNVNNTARINLIRNSTFSANSASGVGGAIGWENSAGTMAIQNSTIANNTAKGANGGGGIAVLSGSGKVTLQSTIVAKNVASANNNEDLFSANTVTADNCAITTATGVTTFTPNSTTTSLLGQDFKLGVLGSYGGSTQTHVPADDSPVIGKGINPLFLTYDQRGEGFVRVSGVIDIGAIEVQHEFTYINLGDSGIGSLRQAILNANANPGADTVTAGKTFPVPSTFKLTSGEIAITDAVTIVGAATNGGYTISGNNASRIFNTTSAPDQAMITISGFTFTDGAVGAGQDGGAMLLGNEIVTITDCVFTKNSAQNGGAISGNDFTSRLTLRRCTFSANTATSAGGAIHENNGIIELNVIDSTLWGNKATTGGAISFAGAIGGSMHNVTISGNSASSLGGGVYWYSGTGSYSIYNSTITNNSAGSTLGGGGIAANVVSGSVNLESTLVAGNFHTAGSNVDFYSTQTINANHCAIGSTAGIKTFKGDATTNSLLGLDFKLGSLLNNGGPTLTHKPSSVSPVRSKGSNPLALEYDQRGISRKLEIAPDIGAVEIDVGSFIVSNTNDAGTGSLRRAVQDASISPINNIVIFDTSIFNNSSTITLTTGPIIVTRNVSVNFPFDTVKCTITSNGLSSLFDTTGHNTSTSITFTRLTFDNGASGTNAAFDIADEFVAFNDCTFSNNKGGAIAVTDGGRLIIIGCTLANNEATVGGAIYFSSGGSLAVQNSTLSGNKSTFGSGGAIDFRGNVTNELIIRSSTIVNNYASSGGGIARLFGTGDLVLESSIVSGNGVPFYADIASSTPVQANWCALGSTTGYTLVGSNNLPIGIDLKLGPLGSHGGGTHVHMPAWDSPVINQGSNPTGFISDQRGFTRTLQGAADIGAVEVGIASITSLVRDDPSPTAASTVNWRFTRTGASHPFSGLTAANFNLSGPGAVGASITNVDLPNATITASTGAEGALQLNFVNNDGLSLQFDNLPFAGEAYTVDKLPLSAMIATNVTTINDYKVGSGMLTLAAFFSEPMDTTSSPVFDFPVENPGLSLGFAGGAWDSPFAYFAKYNVFDLNVSIPNIDVRLSGGKDSGGNLFGQVIQPDLLDIDTQNPVVVSMVRDDPSPTKAAEVAWTVTFSEVVSELSATNFLLFNGGLGGSPGITSVMGNGTTWTVKADTGSGEGQLGLYLNSTAGVTDGAGNPLGALPVQGPAYSVDHVSPAAAQVTPSTLTITDADVGPAGFSITIKYNEVMNQAIDPVVSFPVEDPSPTLSFASGQWLDAKTYRATYSVTDMGLFLEDVDVMFTGGQDAVGNVHTPLTISELFDIDMESPTVANVVINGGAAQRSRVTTIDVEFDRHVSFVGTPEAAFELKRQSDGTLPTIIAAVDNAGAGTKVTLTFTGATAVDFGSLADGRYTLTVLANQVFSGGGLLDGNGDQTGGDDFVLLGTPANGLFRLFGDSNGDGSVTALDFNAFRLDYGVMGMSIFDFDNNGSVSAADFNQFRLRYGVAV